MLSYILSIIIGNKWKILLPLLVLIPILYLVNLHNNDLEKISNLSREIELEKKKNLLAEKDNKSLVEFVSESEAQKLHNKKYNDMYVKYLTKYLSSKDKVEVKPNIVKRKKKEDTDVIYYEYTAD